MLSMANYTFESWPHGTDAVSSLYYEVQLSPICTCTMYIFYPWFESQPYPACYSRCWSNILRGVSEAKSDHSVRQPLIQTTLIQRCRKTSYNEKGTQELQWYDEQQKDHALTRLPYIPTSVRTISFSTGEHATRGLMKRCRSQLHGNLEGLGATYEEHRMQARSIIPYCDTGTHEHKYGYEYACLLFVLLLVFNWATAITITMASVDQEYHFYMVVE